MLSRFDWLRRCRTGAELLATLKHLESDSGFPFSQEGELGPPHSALSSPCHRCWVQPRNPKKPNANFCVACQAVLSHAWRMRGFTRRAIVVWGFVNQLPRMLRERVAPTMLLTDDNDDAAPNVTVTDDHLISAYIHDDNHFLAMLFHRELQPWLQQIVLYDGDVLKGMIQIFPTTGIGSAGMGELLCRIVHNEARYPTDRLRVRFHSNVQQIFDAPLYEREGVLTFEAAEFLRMLDLAVVFRSVLRPDAQKFLHELLLMEDTSETPFYWGRFIGSISREAKDMLSAWKIRTWTKPQVELLYDLVEYVGFYFLD